MSISKNVPEVVDWRVIIGNKKIGVLVLKDLGMYKLKAPKGGYGTNLVLKVYAYST